MTPEELLGIAAKEKAAQAEGGIAIHVCVAAGCMSSGADKVKDALAKGIAAVPGAKACRVTGVGCMGLCEAGPLVQIGVDGPLYREVKADDSSDLLKTLVGKPFKRLSCPTDTPFFKRQKKIVLENCGIIDPERLEDYIARDGYAALQKAVTHMSGADIVQEVTTSGLRGRGGARFPTGLKWNTGAQAHSDLKYVVCNADEGDPGAFMDRSVLESDPHRVLEGMAIAGYAVGASKAYVYVRAEYPLAVKRLQIAIRQAEKLGLLGQNIMGTQFSFNIQLRMGAGAFVCGEETALMASVEGKRGTPRPRPPFPAQAGLWGKPTLINNVETFANIPPILRNGGDWFARIGTEKSK